jgi:hypothetical protein
VGIIKKLTRVISGPHRQVRPTPSR